MADASLELWLIVAGIGAAFVLAMLGVLSRWIAEDTAVRALRSEVMDLRTEYARRTAEVEIVEAEEERLDSMVVDLDIEPGRKAA